MWRGNVLISLCADVPMKKCEHVKIGKCENSRNKKRKLHVFLILL